MRHGLLGNSPHSGPETLELVPQLVAREGTVLVRHEAVPGHVVRHIELEPGVARLVVLHLEEAGSEEPLLDLGGSWIPAADVGA